MLQLIRMVTDKIDFALLLDYNRSLALHQSQPFSTVVSTLVLDQGIPVLFQARV